MSNPSDTTNTTPAASTLLEKSRERLIKFFQQPSVKKLVPLLVPSALAAALLPVFGPVVAGAAAVVAVKNGLSLLGISFSDDTIKKLVKPLEGQNLDEDEMQDVLEEALEKLLPEDKQVNDEAAKALVTIAPEVKEAALANPKLDTAWLGQSLEISMQQQGQVMANVAPQLRDLVLLDKAELQKARDQLLANWSRITMEVSASRYSEVEDVEQNVEGRGGDVSQRAAADDHSKIKGVKQNTKLT